MKRIALVIAIAACLLPAPHASAHVFWANLGAGTIGRANADGSIVQDSFIVGASSPLGLAVDDQHVYWVNRYSIGRANVDGSDANQTFFDIAGAYGLAVDSQHIYWSNGTNAIGRANLDGSDADPTFISGLGNPFALAVDGRHIYWANNSTDSIGRANLDGSDADPKFITGGQYPIGVAVDSGHLYWTNYSSSAIGRAGLDGTEVDQSFIPDVHAPSAVASDGQHIFWASLGVNTLGRANVDGGRVNTELVTDAQSPYALAVEPPPGTATPNSSTLDFGDQTVGATSTAQPVTVTNSGPGHLNLGSLWLDGDNPDEFAVADDGCSYRTLEVGDSCTVLATFNPSVSGARSATLDLPSNAEAGLLQIALSGTGSTAQQPSGPAGPAGPVGGTGPVGPAGHGGSDRPASPTAPNGLSCKTKRKKVTCTVTIASSSAPLAWQLVRHGRIYARGLANVRNGKATIRLAHTDRLPRGRYVLRITGWSRGCSVRLR